MRSIAMAGALLLALASVATAQVAPPLTSNRPGIGESEALVGTRVLQLESGFSLSGNDGDESALLAVPQITVRLGLHPRYEIFVSADGLLWSRDREGDRRVTHTGGSDVSVNGKVALLSEAAHGVTLSLAGGASLPTGTGTFSSGGVDASLRGLWGRSLPADFTLSGNLLIASTTVDDHRNWLRAAAAAISHPLTGTAEWFTELYGTRPERADEKWILDGGVAVLSGSDLQVDLSGGTAVGGHGPHWFISAGITVRKR